MKQCATCDVEMVKLRHRVRDENKYKCPSCGKLIYENTRFLKSNTQQVEEVNDDCKLQNHRQIHGLVVQPIDLQQAAGTPGLQ